MPKPTAKQKLAAQQYIAALSPKLGRKVKATLDPALFEYGDLAQAQADMERRELLRQEGIEAAQGIAEGAASNVRALGAAQRRGNLAIQAALANSLAQSQGRAGMVAGAGTAGIRQAAATAGQEQARFGLASERQLGRARTAADQAKLGALRFEAEAGTLSGDRQQRDASYQQNVSTILSSYTDRAQASQAIRRMVAFEGDPELRQQYNAVADQVLTGGIKIAE